MALKYDDVKQYTASNTSAQSAKTSTPAISTPVLNSAPAAVSGAAMPWSVAPSAQAGVLTEQHSTFSTPVLNSVTGNTSSSSASLTQSRYAAQSGSAKTKTTNVLNVLNEVQKLPSSIQTIQNAQNAAGFANAVQYAAKPKTPLDTYNSIQAVAPAIHPTIQNTMVTPQNASGFANAVQYAVKKEQEEQEQKAYEEAQKAAHGKNVFQKAWTTIGAGAGQFDSSVAQFVNMAATGIETAEAWLNGGFTYDGKYVKGEAPFTTSLLQPIQNWANNISASANKLSEENQLQAKSAAGKTANEIAAGVIAAAPQAVLALMTMGGSTAGTLATQSAGMTNSVNAALSRLSSNPSYWASFVQEAGGNFAEAKANGATDEQAITAATISGLANAMIEVGGGIEDNAWLNDDTLTKLQKARKLAGSALGEGKEELIQNPITRATQKLVYDKDKAWFSLTDEDAVINPKASAKEFAMGTAVGGILSGSNYAINAGVNAANKANIRNAANSVVQSSLDEAIMQTLTAPQSENMTAAEKVSYIENVKKTANQQTLTEKALDINENQTDNRTTQQNLPQNPISQAQSVITAPQTIAENTQENTARNAARMQTAQQTETEQIQMQTAKLQNQSSEKKGTYYQLYTGAFELE